MFETRRRSNCLRAKRRRHWKRFAFFLQMILFIALGPVNVRGREPSKERPLMEDMEKTAETMRLEPTEKRRLMDSMKRRGEYERRVEHDPAAVDAVFSEVFTLMKGSDDLVFPYYLSEFEHLVRVQELAGARLSPELINRSAETLLSEYVVRQKSRPGWYLSIVDFAIKRSTSATVRQFVLKSLEKEPSSEQDQILNSVYWTERYRGDTGVYNRVLKLFKSNKGDKYQRLALLARLDRERTFPMLRKLVKEARTVPEFNKLASILSSDRTAEAMELILSRVKDFPTVPMDSDRSPTEGIYTEPLLDYIRQAEDERLETALDVMLRTPARIWSYPVLVEKLTSKSPRSRKAVMSCLKKLFATGDFIGKESRDVLRKHLKAEVDETVRTEGQAALDELLKHLKSQK